MEICGFFQPQDYTEAEGKIMKLKNKKNEDENKQSCENLCNLVVRKRKMLKDERGQLSIDFLVGISLFILALLFMAHFIPGMFVPFQSETIDLNSVAYRTSVILVEDPGWWDNGEDWENHIENVSRVGLAIDKEHPNMLNKSKRYVFENETLIDNENLADKLGLYRMIGDNKIDYGYNISIEHLNGSILATRGEIPPEYGDVVKTKRIVWMQTGLISLAGTEGPLEGTDNPTKALVYINSSDVEVILDDDVCIVITNFTITDPNKPQDNTFDSIRMANSVRYADGVGWKLDQPTGTIQDDGVYTSLLNCTTGMYDSPLKQSLKTKRTINNENDTLEIFLAKSVFVDNSEEEGGKLAIGGSKDLYIELQFGVGIKVLKTEKEDYPPGTTFKSNLAHDYEPRELIIKVWQ